MGRPSAIVGLLVIGLPVPAAAELRPISRNPLVFVTSAVEGQEWQAYRIARPQEPAAFRVEGPGRVLLQLRAIVEGEEDEDSVAAVLVGDRAVLTARLDPQVDGAARLVDQPKSRRPSKLRLFLVQIDRGVHRLTVRHSAGSDLLVAARFAPPLEEWDGRDHGSDLPLVSPQREPSKTVQNVGAIEEGQEGLQADPPPSSPRATPDWETETREEQLDDRVRRGDPAVDNADDVVPNARTRAAVGPVHPLTVEAPYFQFELRGGVLFSGFNVAPAPIVGVDARLAVPGLDAARWTVGVALDVTHTSGDTVARSPRGAPISVVEMTQTALLAGVDLRYVWLRLDRRLDAYASLGATGLFGTIVTETVDARRDASLAGGLGTLRIGGTLGDRGSRPFAELRIMAGVVQSDLVRRDGGAAGDPTGYSAISIVVGYRVELLSTVGADVR